MKDDFSRIFRDVNKILVFSAHPDDLDVMCGGTAARLIKEGKEVFVVVCTNGALGSKQNEIDMNELAKIRKVEQTKAAEHLGISSENIVILENQDCCLTAEDNKFTERVVYHMRKFRPDFIITHDPITMIRAGYQEGLFGINHRDHRAVGGAVVNAIMPMARDINFFPEHKIQGMDGLIVKKFMIDSNAHDCTAGIDITEFRDQKIAALHEHKTQLDEEVIKRLTDRNEYEGKYFELFKYYELAF